MAIVSVHDARHVQAKLARMEPPRTCDELVRRARALEGKTLGDLARALGGELGDDAVRTKGKSGELVERALGATGGSARAHDFPELAVELKTIPVGADLAPRESTYVCTLPMEDADRAEWETSWVRAKLARVLWVPLVVNDGPIGARTIGRALLWSPTPEQDAILRVDFEEALGAIALGHVEALTAKTGRWLQVRPKAKDGAQRTLAWGKEGERITTVPRGFYLRASFTGALLRDPCALPP
jgi:DNA mismatch repair protein MutH